jgi:hypothetical protein
MKSKTSRKLEVFNKKKRTFSRMIVLGFETEEDRKRFWFWFSPICQTACPVSFAKWQEEEK